MRRLFVLLLALAAVGCGTSHVVTVPTLPYVPHVTQSPVLRHSSSLQNTRLALRFSGTLSGPSVGDALTASTGTWTNNPTSFTYQWQDCNSSASSCSNISGATSATYTVATGDAGYYLRVIVTAHNARGAASAASALTGQVPGTTTSSTTSSPGGAVPCALTHAAGAATGSCWDVNTGVQGGTGYTEAQILAGDSDLTYHNGDITASTPGETISNEWVNGCIAVDAANVTIENVLIHSTDKCEGGNDESNASAINAGFTGAPGLLVKYVTADDEDPGNLPLSTGADYGISLGEGDTCDYCNSFGFGADYAAVGSSSLPSTIEHSYSPNVADDWATSGCGGEGPHLNNIYVDSVSYVTIENVWMNAQSGGCGDTGAISFLGTYGAPSHDTIDDSYAEGGDGTDLTLGRADSSNSCGSPGMVVTNNALSNDNGFSGTEFYGGWTPTGNTWSGNTVAETGASIAEPGLAEGC